MALTALTLILPNYTLTSDAGTFSSAQLAFVSTLSVLLYAAFVFNQMARHREDFVEEIEPEPEDIEDFAPGGGTLANVAVLFVGLAGIVPLTERVAGTIEDGLQFLQI